MNTRSLKVGTAAALGLAAGTATLALAVQPAQAAVPAATQTDTAAQAAMAAQAGAPAAARTGTARARTTAQGGAAARAEAFAAGTGTAAGRANCSGRVIDRKVATYRGKAVAELVVFYKAGRNCARMNHLGATRGVNLRTSVFLAVCKQRHPAPSCGVLGRPAAEDRKVRYYAGPVWKAARGHCIHAAGDIYFHGKRHLETRPGASHCR